MHVAVSLAGVLKAVVVTPETRPLAEKAGLRLVQDARALRLEEAFARHRDGPRAFSRSLLFNQRHAELVHTTDMAVYARAFSLFDPSLSMPLSQQALTRLRPISLVLGWGSEVHFTLRKSID